MKRALLFALALAACQDEITQNVEPVALRAETIGFYCQMNLLEHDGPKGQVHLEGLPGAPLFFSQVSDLVTYLRLPEQSHNILAIYVSDMGAPGATWEMPGETNWIDARTAHYVVGGDLAGGMGAPELAPFADFDKAQEFVASHGGRILPLDEIPASAVLVPGEEEDGPDDYSDRLRALTRG